MNRDIKNRFFRINASISAYQSACREAYSGYVKAERKAIADASQYKDEKTYIDIAKATAAEAARARILSARETMVRNVEPEVEELEKEYRSQLMGSPAPGFFDRLRAYRDFGLDMSKAEAEQFLKETYGSPMAIKALSKVLEDSGARFSISGGVDYESDLQTIRRVIAPDTLCTGYADGSARVWTGQPRIVQNWDGEYRDSGFRWDTSSIANASGAFEATASAIREMGDRWAGGFQPHISQLANYKPKQTEDGETISAEQQFMNDLTGTANSIEIERNDNSAMEKLAGQKAEQAKTYNTVMRHYMK